MDEPSGMTVFWILGPLFVAVGLYLAWYTRRRRRLLETFAARHGFPVLQTVAEPLQALLDERFALEGEGLVRSFGQVASVVEGDGVRLFRAVELLDLNPYAQADSTHFARIAALFGVPASLDAFFLVERDGRTRSRFGGAGPSDAALVEVVRQTVAACGGRHPLSVTFAGGSGLVYFEPRVTGGENAEDISALYAIAMQVREGLSG
jgi:hypothetical protein